MTLAVGWTLELKIINLELREHRFIFKVNTFICR